MNAKTKISIAIVVSVIGFILAVALGMATTFEPPAHANGRNALRRPALRALDRACTRGYP